MKKHLILFTFTFVTLSLAKLTAQSTYEQDIAAQRAAQQRNNEEAVRTQQNSQGYYGGQTRTGNPWPTEKEAQKTRDKLRKQGDAYFKKNDYANAFKAYKEGNNWGDPESSRMTANFYNYGWGGMDKDYDSARELYLRAIENGDVISNNSLGVLYYNGDGVARDYAKAASYFIIAANAGMSLAQYNLSSLYEDGLGVPQSDTEAMKWLQKAIDQKDPHPAALARMARICAKGDLGQKIDYKQAVALNLQAIKLGNQVAKCHLADLYAEGHGVNKDLIKARDLYLEAANASEPYGMHCLGVMYSTKGYDTGMGIDYPHAKRWFNKAVAKDYAPSLPKLGYMYEMGDKLGRIEPNLPEAIRLYRLGAAREVPEAMFRLGNLYLKGTGVPQDRARAIELYQNAAKLGDKDAAKALEGLNPYITGK